jgi:branched-chain amino acid transport system permease protein
MADWDIFGQSLHLVIQTIILGILQGGLYSLIALGIVIINKASGVFNFAHGWMMFAGGLIFWQFYSGSPSTPLTISMVVLAGFLLLSMIFTFGVIKIATGTAINTSGGTSSSPAIWRKNIIKQFIDDWSDNQIDKQRALVALGIGIAVWIGIIILFQQNSSDMLRGGIAAFIGSIYIGLLIERFTIRPLLGQSILTAILMTLAVGFILQGTTQIIWGTADRKINIFTTEASNDEADTEEGSSSAAPSSSTIVVPVFTFDEPEVKFNETPDKLTESVPDYRLKTASWLGADIRLKRFLVWGFGIAVATFVAFTLFFQYTSLGLALRATAENQILAESVGLQVRLMLAISWGLVALMATIAGVIQGTGGTGVAILVIPFLALRVFPAVLLGGLESITGAMVGGLVIGIVEQLTTIYIDTSAAQQMAPFVVLMIVLLIRPDGLFGQRRIDRV